MSPDANVKKPFLLNLKRGSIKLECLTLAGLSSIVKQYPPLKHSSTQALGGQGAHPREEHQKGTPLMWAPALLTMTQRVAS